jgi:hypothetical protein
VDYPALLQALSERRIEVLVVGGVAAVLQGVPTTTFDLDLVPESSAENLHRLHELLLELDAVYREHLPKRLVPKEADLARGHHLLSTRLGPLDVLVTIDGGRGFGELQERTHVLDLGGGLCIRVLDLAELIAMKERLGREKDRASLPLLRRTLRERGREDR